MSAVAVADRATTAAAAAAVERLPSAVRDALPDLLGLLDDPPRDDAWLPRAACRGMDPATFYPSSGNTRRAVGVARGTCDRCPVRWECLADALRWEPRYHRFGIWGGLNGWERTVVLKAVDAVRRAS